MNKGYKWPLLTGALLRVLMPWYGHGFRYMDEHWQVIEPANYLVHHVWSRTVEWEQGLRCWIYPWFVSLLLRLAETLGFHEPIWIVAFARTIHGLIAASAIALTYLAVEKLIPQKKESRLPLLAAWFVALWPFAVYCSFHTQGEMFGALFVLIGTIAPLFIGTRAGRAHDYSEREGYLLAGAFFGLALAVKIDVAVAGLGFGLWQVLNGRIKRALYLAAGVLPFVFLMGLVDKLTWGVWFQNVIGHGNANLVEHVGDQWGTSPWYTHALYFFDIAGVTALVAALALPWVWKRLPEALRAIWFMNAFFIAVFSFIPHKEKRFMAPLVYTGIVAGFATLSYVWTRLTAKNRRILAIACGAVFVAHFVTNVITYEINRPWWDRIRAMRLAGQIPGIEKMFSPQWPAQFYLPRNLPAKIIGADDESLRKAVKGLRNFSVATDWTQLSAIEKYGFKCVKWPTPKPPVTAPIPWAYHCKRLSAP